VQVADPRIESKYSVHQTTVTSSLWTDGRGEILPVENILVSDVKYPCVQTKRRLKKGDRRHLRQRTCHCEAVNIVWKVVPTNKNGCMAVYHV